MIAELTKFGTGQIEILGKDRGGDYIKRCLECWREQYGDQVADQVKAKLAAVCKGEK